MPSLRGFDSTVHTQVRPVELDSLDQLALVTLLPVLIATAVLVHQTYRTNTRWSTVAALAPQVFALGLTLIVKTCPSTPTTSTATPSPRPPTGPAHGTADRSPTPRAAAAHQKGSTRPLAAQLETAARVRAVLPVPGSPAGLAAEATACAQPPQTVSRGDNLILADPLRAWPEEPRRRLPSTQAAGTSCST